jgi:hypothetical protein
MEDQAPKDLRDQAHRRARGNCECVMKTCGHVGRCNAVLRGDWVLHRFTTSGAYTLRNVVVLCQDCFGNMPSYN